MQGQGGGPREPLDLSSVGGGCGVIVLTVTDCPGSVCQSFTKMCSVCAGMFALVPWALFCVHPTSGMNLVLPCCWKGSADGNRSPWAGWQGEDRKSFGPGCFGVSGTC